MRVPEVADRLREKAVEHDDPELSYLAEELRRRPSGPRTEPRAKPVTPELAGKIRLIARTRSRLSQQEIAFSLGVNQGRVSEVLRGRRT